ncbi:MAG: UTP--glucose-1-phosphate uridylyltransferase [Bacteroidales bacterium]|nr:UTP--glucose-1-phosphate uridylyltransferase [Bacteroidales bacterium]
MGKLTDIIVTENPVLKDHSLDSFCISATTEELLDECKELDQFRRESGNLYFKVRSLFFLYAIHRFHLPFRKEISHKSLIPFDACEHILKRRFEEAIDIFLGIQERYGINEGISSGLAEAYHNLAFKILADQVRYSVRSIHGNQWMFRVGHPQDHPLKVRKELLTADKKSGLYPILNESTPVRMDITHSGWSDIFFLGMDFPEGAQVLNISVNLQVREKNRQNSPKPPIDTYFRVIDQAVLKLTSIDLGATTCITKLEDVFDFAKDYLGLLKAAVIASGIVPAGMEGSGTPLSDLLERLVGEEKGIEIISKVHNIPKGSRLAVSTNLLASLIAVCMRATGQTDLLTGTLHEEERRLVAARAILGEWIGGSGGGWQDSGGVWPGIKLIKGVLAGEGDPEYGISKGRLLPQHTILNKKDVSADTRKKLQDCLVMVHGGMAQDVGPVLEMVTEKYLLRSEAEWIARKEAIKYFDEVVNKLKAGDIKSIGSFTQQNFEGPIQTIIPWTSNIYTETLIQQVKKYFCDNFWGFWMMGGMSGGGMGFVFNPEYKEKAQDKLQIIMSETKKIFENAVPFAMEPVVYDFSINESGTQCKILECAEAILPVEYYTLTTPALLKKELSSLTDSQLCELEILGKISRNKQGYENFVSGLFENMLPQTGSDESGETTLGQCLSEYGFDSEMHQQVKSDLKSGRIGLAQNRLPVNSKIVDVDDKDVVFIENTDTPENEKYGIEALKRGELALVTLAGGIGSRWTKGAGVVKPLNHFSKLAGKHRSFMEVHLAKNKKISCMAGRNIPHIFTTSYLTHNAIDAFLKYKDFYGFKDTVILSPGRVIGLRLIPTERELRYLWEEMPRQLLDEQAQKVQESLHNALISWARDKGEAEDYTDNLPHQCIHPVGHWYEIPNMFLNGTLYHLMNKQPSLKYLFIQNIDTLGANADPAIFGYHIQSKAAMTVEVITRKLDDRGGGLAKIDGKVRLIEGLALPDDRIEFELTYYNTNSIWIDINKLLDIFGLSGSDLNNPEKVKESVREMSRRMPTYITLKDVKKRWGKGQEDIFPVVQFEKLWGDMTALSELSCNYLVVSRLRGQQLKEVSQLDGWFRDGSARFVESLCEW